MKTETINRLIGDLGDEALSCEFEAKASRPRKAFRYAAAACMIIIGATVFAAFTFGQTMLNYSNQEALSANMLSKPADVPKDAVQPPAWNENSTGYSASLLKEYNFKTAYEEAEAVAIVTLGNWLSETETCTFYEAKTEKVYKGNLPDSIVLYQWGSTNNYSKLHRNLYGDRLLVFLVSDERFEYRPCYESLTPVADELIFACDSKGEAFIADPEGIISMVNRGSGIDQLRGMHDAGENLISELCSYVKKTNPNIARIMAELGCDELPVYSLIEMEEYFEGLR